VPVAFCISSLSVPTALPFFGAGSAAATALGAALPAVFGSGPGTRAPPRAAAAARCSSGKALGSRPWSSAAVASAFATASGLAVAVASGFGASAVTAAFVVSSFAVGALEPFRTCQIANAAATPISAMTIPMPAPPPLFAGAAVA